MSGKNTITVKNTDELRTAIEAGYTKDQIEVGVIASPDALASARTEGFTQGHAAGLEEGRNAATKAEATIDHAAIYAAQNSRGK